MIIITEHDRFAVKPEIGAVIREIAAEEERDLGVVIANAIKVAYPMKFK